MSNNVLSMIILFLLFLTFSTIGLYSLYMLITRKQDYINEPRIEAVIRTILSLILSVACFILGAQLFSEQCWTEEYYINELKRSVEYRQAEIEKDTKIIQDYESGLEEKE